MDPFSVDSKEGKGSLFRVVLAFETISKESRNKVKKSTVLPQPWSLLLVEDEDINRKVVAELLQSEGYQVTTASGGNEAIGLIEQINFDVVLMDLHMPGMDGLQTTEQIQRLQEKNDEKLKIIAFTGDVMETVEEDCRKAGMDGIISKPIQIDVLNKTISSVMDSKKRSGSFEKAGENTSEGQEDLLLNQAYLDILFNKIKLEKLSSVVAIFFSSGKNMLDELEQFHLSNDMDGLRETSHRISGMAKHLGLDKLGELAGEIQQQAMLGDKASINQLVEEIQSVFANSSDSLELYMSKISQQERNGD